MNEKVQKKQNLETIISDTLLWLSQTLNNKIIVDGGMQNQITSIIDWLDLPQQITATSGLITTNQHTYRATLAQGGALAGHVTYSIWTSVQTRNTINAVNTWLQNSKRDLEIARSSQSSLKPQGNNTAVYQTQFTNFQNQIEELSDDISEYERVLPLLNELRSIQELSRVYMTSITTRVTELTELNTILWNSNFWWAIANMINAAENRPYTIWEPTNADTQILGVGCFYNTPPPTNVSYTLCDPTSGEAIPIENNVFQVRIGTQSVWVRGVRIRNGQLELQNIQIDPIIGLTFPLTIQLSIRGRVSTATGTNLDQYKTFNLTISTPTLDTADRLISYDNLNQGNAINNRLGSEYNEPRRTILENEIIWEILRANGNQTEIDRIYNNPQQRDLLMERIRSIPGIIPLFPLNQLQNGFRNEMTRLTRNVPIQHLVSINAFTDYIRNNLDQNMTNYVRWEIRTAINTSTHRNNIIRTVMEFQNNIVENTLDNNDHRVLDQAILDTRPQWHPNNRWQRITRRRSDKNNWTKFLDGRESSGLTDTLETNEGELGFNLKVAVQWVNKIVVTININGEDEPIILDTRDVNNMTHMILRLETNKSGEPINRKLRCRMALNAIKAIVSISPTTLHRQYQWNIDAVDGHSYAVDRISARIHGENLLVRWSCANHVNRQRVNHVIFDEQRYKWLHNIHELETGMVALSDQINSIMNAMGSDFREATSRIKASPIMKYNTTNYLRGGPIKRLRWRMRHGETNWNFNFNTSATSWSKTVNIKFEKGVFTLSGTFKNKPYEYKWRNIGTMFRKKIDRERVFDGVELEIFERINESMIGQLRTNNLIWPENFWVTDIEGNKTGRVFMMDNHWDLSYIEIEDRNLNPLRDGRTAGRIHFNDLPPQRIRCNAQERREFMQNPLLSGRLIRVMRKRLKVI